MFKRLWVVMSAAAVGSLGLVTSPAHATGAVEVGGEATAIWVNQLRVGPVTFPSGPLAGQVVWDSARGGTQGTHYFEHVNIGNVIEVGAGKASSYGSFGGQPYAHSDVAISEVRIGSLLIHGLESYCEWSTTTSYAVSNFVGFNVGEADAPQVRIPIPGVGYAYMAERGTDFLGDSHYAIWGYGMHLFIDDITHDIQGDIYIGVASCDPLNLKGLAYGTGG